MRPVRLLSASTLFLFSLFAAPSASSFVCPTFDYSIYGVFALHANSTSAGFTDLLSTFVEGTQPNKNASTTAYSLFFGSGSPVYSDSSQLPALFEKWKETRQIEKYYQQTLAYANDGNDNRLAQLLEFVFGLGTAENDKPATVFRKKILLLGIDYLDGVLMERLQNMTTANNMVISLLTTEPNTPTLENVISHSVLDNVTDIQTDLMAPIPFDLGYVGGRIGEQPIVSAKLVLVSFRSSREVVSAYQEIVGNGACGPSVNASEASQMLSRHVAIEFFNATNATIETVYLPWLVNYTVLFGEQCIRGLVDALGGDGTVDNGQPTTAANNSDPRFELIVRDQASTGTGTWLVVLAEHSSDALERVDWNETHVQPHITIMIESDPMREVYEQLAPTLLSTHFLNSTMDHQLRSGVLQTGLKNGSTICRAAFPLVSMKSARKYVPPKHFYIALDDMAWISAVALISVLAAGCAVYRRSVAYYRKQMEELDEMQPTVQPPVHAMRAEHENAHMVQMPWEIKSDRVHIDFEFPLGEGTISHVYLGKLKGKSPVMHLFDRVELKQFQDCAVAIRVPRQFDDVEEEQLVREICAMKRIKWHNHVALFLGWTVKNGLVCSLLELTHTNLLIYLRNLKDTVNNTTRQPDEVLPTGRLLQIICHICDGMRYLHAHNLVHRDLAARNVLLTTGLRAKISGFGFCSEPEDPKFANIRFVMKYLPIKWAAPEALAGKYNLRSDVWSFSMLLYELYSLGDAPYLGLRPDAVIDAIQACDLPPRPRFATQAVDETMRRCFHFYPERRPCFEELLRWFFQQFEQRHDNQAFDTGE